jgi:hypothetical protein
LNEQTPREVLEKWLSDRDQYPHIAPHNIREAIRAVLAEDRSTAPWDAWKIAEADVRRLMEALEAISWMSGSSASAAAQVLPNIKRRADDALRDPVPTRYAEARVRELEAERDALRVEAAKCVPQYEEVAALRVAVRSMRTTLDQTFARWEEARAERDALRAIGQEQVFRADKAEAKVERKHAALVAEGEDKARLAAEVERLRAQVKRWESEEIRKASCCVDNEARAKRAEAALLRHVERLRGELRGADDEIKYQAAQRKRAEAALLRHVERDHAEALRIEALREEDYKTHGPWCRCADCMRLWPTNWKLPARAALHDTAPAEERHWQDDAEPAPGRAQAAYQAAPAGNHECPSCGDYFDKHEVHFCTKRAPAEEGKP